MLGGAAVAAEADLLKKVIRLVNTIYAGHKEIMAGMEAANAGHDEAKKAETLCEKIKPRMDALRESVDELENLVDDERWPLPKFWEMLFIC